MNKLDFLNAICGKPVNVTIDGLDLEIRSLTLFETEQIHNQAQTNDLEAALLTVVYGLVTPELNKSDVDALKQGKPGLIMKIAKSISELSGLTSEDSPTVGNG
mgnify:FL=1